MEQVYLDVAASTPMDPRVIACMQASMEQEFANPHAQHPKGQKARATIEAARLQVAETVEADPQGVIWTSGATEANNLILKGIAGFATPERSEILTTAIEHASILQVCRFLGRYGLTVRVLPVLSSGLLDLTVLKKALSRRTLLVSIGAVNNELGTIQNIKAVVEYAHLVGAMVHVDAAQSVGRIPLSMSDWGADWMSVSAHKVYGPKGIGALIARPLHCKRLKPLLEGGGQEQGIRAGTLPTSLIVGMGVAFGLAKRELARDTEHVKALRKALESGLEKLPLAAHGAKEASVCGILNLCFKEASTTALEHLRTRLHLSVGSACSAGLKQSHVLEAIGVSAVESARSLRLSFGRFTSFDEIAIAIKECHHVYQCL